MNSVLSETSAWIKPLPTGWQYYRLSDLVIHTVDNRGKTPPTVDEGIPLIGTFNINSNYLYPTTENLRYVAKETFDHWFRSHPQPDDIIITNKGEYRGTVCLVPDPVGFCMAQDMIALRVNRQLVHPHYLLAVLRSDFFRHQVSAFTVSTTIPHLRKTDFDRLVIPAPLLEEQNFIGQLYVDFSRKIEANRRMNETLEAIARAIFKSWFVDFDPVHYKARGEHPPGMDAETAALFPDSFEDSELGPIPHRWRVGNLGDVVENFDSKRIPLSSRAREKRRGKYRYYGAASIMDYVDDYLFDGIYLLMAEDGSVIDVNGNPVLQYVWGQFWVNNHAHILQGKNGVSTEQVYLALQRVQINPYITGAVQPKINQGNMNRIPIVIANNKVNTAFQKVIEPLFAQIRAKSDETLTLAETRDALLPKLVSGELRVGDVEAYAEDAL